MASLCTTDSGDTVSHAVIQYVDHFHEDGNPKHEIRNKSEFRISNVQNLGSESFLTFVL